MTESFLRVFRRQVTRQIQSGVSVQIANVSWESERLLAELIGANYRSRTSEIISGSFPVHDSR